jgi:hypothetical protein
MRADTRARIQRISHTHTDTHPDAVEQRRDADLGHTYDSRQDACCDVYILNFPENAHTSDWLTLPASPRIGAVSGYHQGRCNLRMG